MACRWQPGMKITALLDALNSALAEPFALAWVSNSPRFLLVFTVIYAVAVIVAVTDQKNTHPGAEHGSAAWGDVFRLNKFYMDRHGSNLLLTQHFHIGIDGYKHKHNTNILIVGGSGAGKTRTYGVPNVLECACSMVITDPKSEILRKTGNLLKQKGYEVLVFDLINPAASFCYNPFVYVHDDREVLTLIENLIQNTTPSHSKSSDPFWEKSETALLQALMLYLLHEAPPEEQNFPMVMEMIAAAEVHEDDDNYQSPLDILFERLEMREPDSIACKQYRIFKQAAGVVCSKRLLNQAVGKSLRTHNLKPKKGAQVMRKNEKITALYERLSRDDFGKDDDQQRESNSISNQKAVQKIRGNVRRYPDGWGEAAPLTGLLYCADCGGKMYVHRTNNGKRISQYTCSQYSKVPVGKLCTTQHRINEDVVLSLVSEMLKAIAEYAKHDRAEFVRVVQEAQSSQQTAEVKKQRTRLATAKQRVSELEVLLCKIYEDNILGKLSDSRYATLDAQYEKEQSELTAEISVLEKAVKSYEKHEKDADRFIALIDKYENFDKLTIAM